MQDQTHELKKVGIKATYLGSAQFAPHEVFSQDSDTLIVFVSPEWLVSKDDRQLMKFQSLYREGRLGYIAIDEVHLIGKISGNRIDNVRSYMPYFPAFH